ncbi:MAG: 50S ribosomal protein L15 [Candidatus Nanopelagicales bacterium]|jgi:large subunit ribosomal protein L15|nr:50S ribosomal protein L15 [Actinomycetes bacterium]MCH9830679.1 50S ribosomal protein L15 [Actinomycetes bacterium]MCH9840713.1 50S ribosomal protein L15 [Actinomycetes bacterium]
MTLKVHHLRPAPGAKTAKTRKGRGEASKGKTSGRGTKGTKARYQVKAGFEGGQMPLHMRLPKLKGFTSPNTKVYQVINVAAIEKLFPEGGTIGVAELVAAGAVRKGELVKVLGQGDIAVKVNVTADKFSGAARDKIVAAGGSVTEL